MKKTVLELNGITVTVLLVLVTPTLAAEWLKKNKRNRPVSAARTKRYAKEMAEGRWKFNGMPILFDWDGSMLDAQHRLHACIESGESFVSLVVEGMDPECFPSIDQGAKRTLADNLALLDHTNYTTLAAAAAYLRRYEKGVLFSTGTAAHVSVEEGIETVDRHPGMHESIHYGRGVRNLLSSSLAAFLHYVFALKDPDAADDFMERLATGEMLTKNTGLYLLRDRLVREKLSKASLPQEEVAALVIKAWNAHREGRTLYALRWRRTGERPEAFPEVG